MKRIQAIVIALLILAAMAVCSRSVLGQGSGNTPGSTTHQDYTTCNNSAYQPCGDCPCSNHDSTDSKTKDCSNDEGAQTTWTNSPAGVIESAGESFAMIDDDGPAAAPASGGCPSCTTMGADIPEDSQLMRLRLSRIWRSTWHSFGSFGQTMYMGYDYWVSLGVIGGTNLLIFVDPNNSMEADFHATGNGAFI